MVANGCRCSSWKIIIIWNKVLWVGERLMLGNVKQSLVFLSPSETTSLVPNINPTLYRMINKTITIVKRYNHKTTQKL